MSLRRAFFAGLAFVPPLLPYAAYAHFAEADFRVPAIASLFTIAF